MHKKLFTIALTAIMVVAMAVPTFAWDADGWAHYAAAWNGANGGTNAYMCMSAPTGYNGVLKTVSFQTGNPYTWEATLARHGNYVMWAGTSKTQCVNINRTLISNLYYNATLYTYEEYSSGMDQRIVFEGSKIKLAQPQMANKGPWYLQTDYSNYTQASSNIIWYTNSSGSRVEWAELL